MKCNLLSLINSINHLGYETKLIKNKNDFKKVDKIILPGVGSFENSIEFLKKSRIEKEIIKFTMNKKNSLLGICLGMQLLFEKSEETKNANYIDGLNLIKGFVSSFSGKKKFINTGWRNLTQINNMKIIENLKNKTFFYFVHGYFCHTNLNNLTGYAFSEFNKKIFLAAIRKENIFGTQFHPEKSSTMGLEVLKNFCDIKNQ